MSPPAPLRLNLPLMPSRGEGGGLRARLNSVEKRLCSRSPLNTPVGFQRCEGAGESSFKEGSLGQKTIAANAASGHEVGNMCSHLHAAGFSLAPFVPGISSRPTLVSLSALISGGVGGAVLTG